MNAAWKRNPLFRALVFLDMVGLQPFSAWRDLTGDGVFVDVARIFNVKSVIYDILLRGLCVFCTNVTRFFSDETERAQVLRLVGDPNDPTTSFTRGVLAPPSLTAFLELMDDGFPLCVRLRIEEVFGLTDSVTTMAEQFLIDALDDWMRQRMQKENDALVLACGVPPEVLMSARARPDELPHAVEDFIIDVVFPPPAFDKTEDGKNIVIDWLIASYEKCHETIDVDKEENESLGESAAKKERKEDLEEEFLTSENLDKYMREQPSLVPKQILREKRRPLCDPTITEFELQKHYTANELSSFVRGELGERRRLKKAGCVRAILKHHGSAVVKRGMKEECA